MPRKSVTAEPLPLLLPSNYTALPTQEAPAGAKNVKCEIRNSGGSSNPELYIYSTIAPSWLGVSAQDVIEALQEIGDVSEIDLHLNSPGGSMFEGVAIYNALIRNGAKINVFVDALAASAASFVAQAGDTVTMSRGSMMMIHDASAIVYGNAEEMRETADLLDKSSQNIADLYASRAGQDAKFWRGKMQAETWYGAQEAVDAGLADKLAGTATEDPENHWDLSVFNYAGRSKAPSPTMIVKEPTVAEKDDKTPAFSMKIGEVTYTDPAAFQTALTELENKVKVAAPTPPATQPPFSMTLAGVEYTDKTKYDNAVATLVNFQNETRTQGRKDFVANLAKEGKITAPQMGTADKPGVEAFALGLSDELFASWKATWDGAPQAALLGKHGGTVTPTTGDPSLVDKVQDSIDIAKATVKQHRAGGMTEDRVKNTASYKLLEKHNAVI